MAEGAVNPGLRLCVDVGSTYTKAVLVDLASARVVAAAERPTTLDADWLDRGRSTQDVLDGVRDCIAELGEPDAPILACSSAGGGLRIGVVGTEELVTAEAGRRVALSSGGRVVEVLAGPLTKADVASLRAANADVVLLVGGTDGGNAEVLVASADRLRIERWRRPVVVAGNVEAQHEVAARLTSSGTPFVLTENVVPQIGVLAPHGARAAIRQVFLEHVIGGKGLSRGPSFARLVRAPTPDVVLAAVELLAEGRPGVAVVDIGGATTDVYSVVDSDLLATDDAGLSREVVAGTAANRTVEGDLGMRWSAVTTTAAAVEAGFGVPPHAADRAEALRRQPGTLPASAAGVDGDLDLAAWAAALALRRHAGRAQVRFELGGQRLVERSGIDLRDVALVVGSGGALRHAGAAAAEVLLRDVSTTGGWQLPEAPRVVIDRDYLLMPAGLLAGTHRDVARRLLASLDVPSGLG